MRMTKVRAVATAVVMILAGSLLVAPERASAAGDTDDRAFAVSLLTDSGPSTRRAAESALLGSDADLRAFLATGRVAAQQADDRAAAQVLAGMDGPAVRAAALHALDGSPEQLRQFVEEGWKQPWAVDERLRVQQVLEAGGPRTKQAAAAALAGTAEDWSEFLLTGRAAAELADDRLAATRMLAGAPNGSGPNLDAAAQRALGGSADQLREFLMYGQFVSRARDTELASIKSLTEQAKQAGETTARESLAAAEASARAVNAAQEAKQAAETAAAEAEAAGGAAGKASAAAGRAADAAAGAAQAAREAIAASNAAMRAAEVAADGARRATAAASLTAQAATRAQRAAANARTDANQAAAARAAAQAARDAAAKARELQQVKAERDRAIAQARAAAQSAHSAAANADAAAVAADEASHQAGVSAAQAQRAREAAAAAQREAHAAARAADRALSFAQAAAAASDEAFAFAAEAADHAERAAAAAETAAEQAGIAAKAAEESAKHAAAAVEAANVAVAAANQAVTLEQLARQEDAARLAEWTEQGVKDAQAAAAQEQVVGQDAGEYTAWNRKLLWDTAEQDRIPAAARTLLAEATAAGAPTNVVLDRGRRAAVTLIATGGQWTRAAAEDALAGDEFEMRIWLATGRTAAAGEDDRERVWRLVDTLPDGPEQTAARAALDGDNAAVATFLRTRAYTGKFTDDRRKIFAILNANPGPSVKAAAERALAGTPADAHEFLRAGQYPARTADDRLEISRIMTTGGPEVKAAAQVALAGPGSYASYFLAAGRHLAAQRDYEQATHVAAVAALIKQAQQYAETALADAAEANRVAAVARNAADEARRWADEAAASADLAAQHAAAAQASAASAKRSADEAAQSAETARNAANSAQASANAAAQSAATATAAARQAQADARTAQQAKQDARQAALDAGNDAQLAAQAAKEAMDIYTNRLRSMQQEDRNTAAGSGPDGSGSAADQHRNWSCLLPQAATMPKDCLNVYLSFTEALVNPMKCASPSGKATAGCQMLHDIQQFIEENPEVVLDLLQLALMGCGLVPVVGEPCDAIDAAISFVRGDVVGGFLSLGSMVPVLGWGTAAPKMSDKLRDVMRIIEKFRDGCKATSSFVPGTRVLLAGGRTVPIEDVRVGDAVVATEPAVGRTALRPVTALRGSSGTKVIVDIAVDDDGDRRTPPRAVSATAGHPFWVPQLGRWVPAKALVAGVALRTADGTDADVVAVSRRTVQTSVHNLTVAGLATYFVVAGDATLLVHNCTNLLDDELKTPAHTIEEHVNPSDADILARAEDLGSDVGRWKDVDTAQKVVSDVVGSKWSEIEGWVNRASRGGAREKVINGYVRDGGSLGVVALPNGQIVPAGNKYRIVLQYTPGHKNGFIVLTSFPLR
jgi:hypothetical protein